MWGLEEKQTFQDNMHMKHSLQLCDIFEQQQQNLWGH